MSLRNVIYYNSSNNQISLAGIAQLPYTDVIIANIQPTSASDLTLQGYGPAFDNNLASNIQALQNAGKNVLISFGGANDAQLMASYPSYAQNVGGLVDDIVNNWVLEYGFNGVDIDYEDDSGFDQPGQPASYDGAGFLVALTNGLYQALPSGQNLITHAPSPPFWDPQGGYYAANTQTAAYTQIWQQAGDQIAWINCQFYDNQSYDQTAALKVYWYQQIAEITGPQQMLVGALVGDPALYEPDDQDEGYITLDDMTNNVIAPLIAQYGSQFGGIMGWEFAQDGPPTYGTAGAWANGIAQALGASATPNLYVFRQGSGNDGQLRYSVFEDTNWGGDTLVPNLGMSESPAAVAWAGGITVFHQGYGDNGQLWYTYSPVGENLSGDTQVQNVGMSGSPSAVVYNGNLYAFHQGIGFNGELCYSIFDGTNWSADGCLNLDMSGSPSAVLWNGGITVFHQGASHNGQLRYTSSADGTHWDGDTQVQNVGMSGSPSAVVYNGLLYVFHQGSGNDGTLRYSVYDGTSWSADTEIPNVGIWSSGSPSAALWKGGITVFHQAASSNLLMYTYSPDGKQWGADTSVNVGMSGSPSCVVV
jgi:chitinase